MTNSRNIRRALIVALISIALSSVGVAAKAPPTSHFVVKDSRDIEENSVRFAAAQIGADHQAVVLLGGDKAVWPKIKGGVEDAEAKGCRVVAILVGPVNARPALEIYAKGVYVTNPINPYTITQAALTNLICDVDRKYYR